ncbi:MAG TPA: von Willebrand factor type A domain-containing protein [Chthoniobacterales bacterium]|jgi:Ca-activated chloride channel family protein|nr:von Willebrand factor type A domain-containing protein [Chthoniobacterales bacterium]
MNMNLDDPKLTAYALDELSGAEKAEMESAVATSPEAQEFVRELRLLSGNLRAEYAAEREAHPVAHGNIVPLEQKDGPWSISRRLALAAGIALCACLGALAIGTLHRSTLVGSRMAGSPADGPKVASNRVMQTPVEGVIEALPSEPAPPAPPPPPLFDEKKELGLLAGRSQANQVVAEPARVAAPPAAFGKVAIDNFRRDAQEPFNTARYGRIEENPFLAALENPLSTFSIDVDTASYSNIRHFIESASLPPKDAVRVEEMINYFGYDYPQPNDDRPFSINLDAASCPWAPSHRLVRIGLQGREMPNEKRPASNLVFLLDVSGSMEPANRLPLVKQAMRLLIDKLGENDRVAVVIYAGASGLALPSTTGDRKEQILSALENLQAGGSTNGAQGIELAYQTAAEHFIKGGVNRIILATDGDFNIGTTSEGDLIRLIEAKAKSGVFLSVLGVGDDNLNDSMMQKLADKGNGNYAYLDSVEEARKVLVRQINGTLVTIAKDVKIQVEFNPARVASYRLIGYEKRLLRKEDFKNDKIDAGEIGAGHSVTALYEVIPNGAAPNPAASVPPVDPLKYEPNPMSVATSLGKSSSPELLTVKLRYKEPEGEMSKLIERPFVDTGAQFSSAAPDLKFAAAVAEFGMILRDSAYKGNGTLGAVAEWAEEGKGADENGYRAGFLALVRKAQELKARM